MRLAQPRRSHLAYVVALALATLAAPAAAQEVRVTVVRTGQAEPLVGAVVSLEREGSEARLAPALTDEQGAALLRAPSAGRYRLRVDYVGIRSWRSPWLTLGATGTLEHRAEIPVQRAELPVVVVQGRSACTEGPSDGSAVTAVWDQARTAVLASALSSSQRAPTLRIRRFTRLLDAGDALEREESDSIYVSTVRPFVALRSAAELSRDGYLVRADDGDLYLAPDAEVLLSEEFATDHCFTLVGDGGRGERVGLEFRPVPGRTRLPEIAGTFWLDRATSELRTLEFRHVNVGALGERARAGGRVDFRRLSSGHWIVSSWHVRTPRPGIARSVTFDGRTVERDTLLGAREEGAEVTAVIPRATARAAAPVIVRGTMYDSVAGRPLGGVRVRVPGTDAAVVTDSDGMYTLRLPSGGAYTMELAHPRLSLYRVPTTITLRLDDGDSTAQHVAIPGVRQLFTQLCPGAAPAGERTAHVVALVSDAPSGRAIAYPAIRASWRRQPVRPGAGAGSARGGVASSSAVGDSAGTLLLCHLPTHGPVELLVESPGYRPWRGRTLLGGGGVHEQLVRLERVTPPASPGSASPSRDRAPAASRSP